MFSPDRVAIVGATDRAGAVGRELMENVRRGFSGTIVPVNPNAETVCGMETVPGLDAIEPVDLAVIAVPPEPAVAAIRSGAEHGIRNFVVITAGFSETGRDGASLEAELRTIASEYDLNLVGPNSLGIISTPATLNATFGPSEVAAGSLSLMSQSGAFITAVLDWAADRTIGFRDVVSLGNKAVLDEVDFVDRWGEDPETKVVLGYLESIEDGRAFMDVADRVTDDTPIVVVKAGRTEAGAKAASSHTGAIAGSNRAYEAGLAQAGVIKADGVQELFDIGRMLASMEPPETNGVAVVTNAGGPGVLTTDAIGDSSLRMASLGSETVDALAAELPAAANAFNPVDIIGDADAERFRSAIDLTLEDEAVGAVVVVAAPTGMLSFEDLAAVIADAHGTDPTPIVSVLMGGRRTVEPARRLAEAGIPTYFDPAHAIRGLDALHEFGRIRDRATDDPTAFAVEGSRVDRIFANAIERGEHRLGVEAMELLEAYGIATPDAEIVDSPTEAREALERLGEPAVMKIVSPDILHKTDIGGVMVGITADEAAESYEDLLNRARNYQPDADILGVQVQEQLDVDDGVETIVGATRDPQFGPLLLFGLGGVFVEVLEDTAVRVGPIGRDQAEAMTREIESAPLLRGARGREPVDIDAVVETIQRLSQLVTDHPEILELDINPLLADAAGATALDVRLTLDPDQL